MKKEVLRMERVTCQEQGVTQLDGFELSILAGEIMGLLPVNNHGLPALLRLLQLNTPLRYGYVYYREKQVNTWRAYKPRSNRIGLIQSESCLVEGLTVADNIFVLRPDCPQWLLRPSELRRRLDGFWGNLGIKISADAYVEDLSDFERTVVDIVKSILSGCKLIVVNDISAEVCEAELKKIHSLLKYYASQGISFIYIDFHFEELARVCGKVALMSNGRIIKVLGGESLRPEVFYSYVQSHSGAAAGNVLPGAAEKTKASPVFEMQNVTCGAIGGISLEVFPGECVALQNVDAQVFGGLLDMLDGSSPPETGRILLGGKPLRPGDMSGIAVIQEFPAKTMLFSEMSYLDNLCFLLDRRMPEIWRSADLREGIRREYEGILGREVFNTRVDLLAERQKISLVYHRVALMRPKVVFCVQPFRQADLELRLHITELMRMLLGKKTAVVILAVNLADSLSLADRLVRVRKNKPVEIIAREEFLAGRGEDLAGAAYAIENMR